MLRKDIDDVIAKLGAEIGFPDLALDESGYVAIINDDSTVLNIDFHSEQASIVIYATVAECTAETRLALYEEMLLANFMWQETLGATLALSPTTDHALLLASVSTEGLDAATFIRFYQNVHRLTWAFSDRFKSLTFEDAEAGADASAPLPGSFA